MSKSNGKEELTEREMFLASEAFKRGLLAAADIVQKTNDLDVDAVRAGCIALGISLAEAAQVTRADVAVAKIRMVAK